MGLCVLPSDPGVTRAREGVGVINNIGGFGVFHGGVRMLERTCSCMVLSYLPALSKLLATDLSTSSNIVVPIGPRVVSCSKVGCLVSAVRDIRGASRDTVTGGSLRILNIVMAVFHKRIGRRGRLMRGLGIRRGILKIVPVSTDMADNITRNLPIVGGEPASTTTRRCAEVSARYLWKRVNCNGSRVRTGRGRAKGYQG